LNAMLPNKCDIVMGQFMGSYFFAFLVNLRMMFF